MYIDISVLISTPYGFSRHSTMEIVHFPVEVPHVRNIDCIQTWGINNEIRLIRSNLANPKIYRSICCIIHRFLARRICESYHRILLSTRTGWILDVVGMFYSVCNIDPQVCSVLKY